MTINPTHITLYRADHYKTKVKIKRKSIKHPCFYYEGLCATQDKEIAKHYGEYLHTYRIPIAEIANNQDLIGDKAVEIIKKELKIDDDTLAKQITFTVASQINTREIFPYLTPSFGNELCGELDNKYDREIWRLRGRIADELGFRAVSYVDDVGFVNYLIVH